MFTLLLTWTAGCVDAINLMRFTVFPANMTGNTVLIAQTGFAPYLFKMNILLFPLHRLDLTPERH